MSCTPGCHYLKEEADTASSRFRCRYTASAPATWRDPRREISASDGGQGLRGFAPGRRGRDRMTSAARQAFTSINSRFEHGHPSNEPDEAGVFIHVWDLLEDQQQPWRPCLLEECKRSNRGKLERFPTSLIYANMPNRGKNDSVPMFADGLRGGLILRPTAAQVRCAYPADGHSRWNADGCACPFPGDIKKGLKRADDCERWCDDPAAVLAAKPKTFGATPLVKKLRCDGRPWRQSHLARMLRLASQVPMSDRMPWGGLGRDTWTGSENNEVIVSPSHWNTSTETQERAWNASMPHLVLAFWYPVSRTGACCNYERPHRCAPRCGERERQVRLEFLRHFNLTEATGPPLLELRRDRWSAPFRMVAPRSERLAIRGGASEAGLRAARPRVRADNAR